jgi:hypothetical protein
VTDPAGRPIPEAQVFFTAAPVATPDIAALTDDDGAFALSAPSAGEYAVAISAPGFAAATAYVTIAASHDAAIDVTLEHEEA